MEEDDNLISEFLHKYTLTNKKMSVPSTAVPGRSVRTRTGLLRNSKSGTTLKSSTRAYSETREKNMLFLRPASSLPQRDMKKKKRIVSSMPYQKYNPKAARKSNFIQRKKRPFTATHQRGKKVKPINPNLQAHFKKNMKAFKIFSKKKKGSHKSGTLQEIADVISKNKEAIENNLDKLRNDREMEEKRRVELRKQRIEAKRRQKEANKPKPVVYYGCKSNWEYTKERLKDNTIAFLNEKIIYFNEMRQFMNKKFGKRMDGVDEIIEEMVK